MSDCYALHAYWHSAYQVYMLNSRVKQILANISPQELVSLKTNILHAKYITLQGSD